jgi:hypothetical protein
MSDISLSSGSLVVDVERKQVTDTIAAVDQGNVSLDSGLLVTKKFASKLNENIKGAMGAMRAATIEGNKTVTEQSQPESDNVPFDPDRKFSQSFRESVTPTELMEPVTIQQTTDQPIPEKPDVEVKELPDAPAASGVQPPAKKEDAPLNVRNNNLGNIKNIQANEWVGQTNLETDETFANFETPQLGVRALTKVVQANINATDTFEEYVNRYASEPDEKDYYAKNGKLMPHLKNYGSVIADSQGINDVKQNIPEDINMLEWIKATARAEGGSDALSYFTDDIIKEGIELAGKE